MLLKSTSVFCIKTGPSFWKWLRRIVYKVAVEEYILVVKHNLMLHPNGNYCQ